MKCRWCLIARARAANVGGVPNIHDMAQVAVDGLVIGMIIAPAGDEVDRRWFPMLHDARDCSQLLISRWPLRDGGVVPPSSVAHLINTNAPQQINHIAEQPSADAQRAVASRRTIEQGVDLPQQDRAQSQSVRAHFRLASAVRLEWFGQQAAGSRAARWIHPGRLTPRHSLLAALFESWIHPFTIITASVPS